MHGPSSVRSIRTEVDIKGRLGQCDRREEAAFEVNVCKRSTSIKVSGNGVREPCTACKKEAVFRQRAFRRMVQRDGSKAKDEQCKKKKEL